MKKEKQPGLLMALGILLLCHWLIQTFEKWLGLGLQ